MIRCDERKMSGHRRMDQAGKRRQTTHRGGRPKGEKI